MRDLEENSRVSRSLLMENAGKAVFNAIKERLDISNKKILAVCYHGNNGGDGLVAARHLSDDAETDILFVGDENRMKKSSGTFCVNKWRFHAPWTLGASTVWNRSQLCWLSTPSSRMPAA